MECFLYSVYFMEIIISYPFIRKINPNNLLDYLKNPNYFKLNCFKKIKIQHLSK